MAWVKCLDRMPEVLLGNSNKFIVREIGTGRMTTSWYGLSANCLMVKRPSKFEWWDDSIPIFFKEDLISCYSAGVIRGIAEANGTEDKTLSPKDYFYNNFKIKLS